MKLFIRFILFFTPLIYFSPGATAQNWRWGRAGVGANIDGWAVATDAAGNIFGAGVNFNSLPLSFGGIIVPTPPKSGVYYQSVWVKYDPSGSVLWADATISGDTYLNNITTDPSGNLIIFGSFSSHTMQIGSFTLTNTKTGSQYFIAKVSPAGTVLWAINDGSDVMPNYLYFFSTFMMGVGSITTDVYGNIYIASAYRGNTMTIGPYTLTNSDPTGWSYDVFVAKYTPSGAIAWASSIGGNQDDFDFGIAVSSTGNVYIAGTFYSASVPVGSSVISDPYKKPKAYIAKFSSSGTPLWAQDAGGINGAFSVGLTSDAYGNIYMTGAFADTSISFGATTITKTYPTAAALLSLFLVQYNSSDVITWDKTIGSPSHDVCGYSVALANCGQVWVCGKYNENAFIDTGDTLALIAGYDPVFIAGYNLSGGVVGYAGVGGGGDDQVGIACDPAGNVYLCSDYYISLTVGPDTLPACTDEAFYLAKYAYRPLDTIVKIDTTICITHTGIQLNATAGYTNYYWNNGATSSSYVATASGKYYVLCTSCDTPVIIDTFNIVAFDTLSNQVDTGACTPLQEMTLFAPAGHKFNLWNTGDISNSISVTKTGTYWVASTEGCNIYTDTFHVTTLSSFPLVSLGNDTAFCDGNTITLNTPQFAGYVYLWNMGSTSSSVTITDGGGYWLTVNNNGCVSSDSIQIVKLYAPPPVNLGPDTILCLGDVVLLATHTDAGSILWSNGSNEDSIAVSESGIYWVSVSNSCGISSDTVKLNFEPCDIVFPSAFTPNGDGKNDIIRAIGSFQLFTAFSLSIFNRYGQRLFYTEDIYAGWDGTYNGTKQDLGTYFYLINYTLQGKHHMMKGDFELIR